MEEALRRLSPLSPQGVDARGREAGELGLGGARVEGREIGGPEVPTNGAPMRFTERASPNATEPGHAPPERVALGDSPAHLALINPDAAPAVPQPMGGRPYLHTTLNVSSTRLCKYVPGSSLGWGLYANEGAHEEETSSGNPFAATAFVLVVARVVCIYVCVCVCVCMYV